jgi:hypothetical protein
MAARNFFICWADNADPTKGLDFFPPKGSDELYEALKEYYPHHKNLQSRMQSAIIDFYVEQQSLDADMTASLVQSPIDMDSMDTMATSPDSTTFDSSFSTPMTQSLSSASPALPKQEDLMQVFTLSSHPSAKIHKRRNMTDAEKQAYKQKRVEGACSDCRRRRRKCTHSTEDPSNQSSSRRSTKRKSSISSSRSSASKMTPAITPANEFMQIEPMANINFNLAFDTSPVPLFEGQEITFDDGFFQKDFQLFDNSFNFNSFIPQSSHQQQANNHSSVQNGAYSGFDLENYIDFNGGTDSLTSSFSSRSSLQQSHTHSSTLQAEGLFNSAGGSSYSTSPSLSPRDRILELSSNSSSSRSSSQPQLIPHNSPQAQDTFTVGSIAEQHVPAAAVEPTVSRSGVFVNNSARLQKSRTIAQRAPSASHSPVDYSSERYEGQASSQEVVFSSSIHHGLQSSVNALRQVAQQASQTLLSSPLQSRPSSRPVNGPESRDRTKNAHTTILLSVPSASLTSKLCLIYPSLTESISSSSAPSVELGLNGLIQPSPTTYLADSLYNSSSAQNLGVDVFTPVMLLMALFIGSLCGLRVVKDVKANYSIAFGIISMLSIALQSLTYSSLAFSVSTLRQRLTSSAQLWSTVLSEESFSHRKAISFTT